jgi:hypothetical protein
MHTYSKQILSYPLAGYFGDKPIEVPGRTQPLLLALKLFGQERRQLVQALFESSDFFLKFLEPF